MPLRFEVMLLTSGNYDRGLWWWGYHCGTDAWGGNGELQWRALMESYGMMGSNDGLPWWGTSVGGLWWNATMESHDGWLMRSYHRGYDDVYYRGATKEDFDGRCWWGAMIGGYDCVYNGLLWWGDYDRELWCGLAGGLCWGYNEGYEEDMMDDHDGYVDGELWWRDLNLEQCTARKIQNIFLQIVYL